MYEWIAFLDNNQGVDKVAQRHQNGKHGEIWRYRFANQVPLGNGDDARMVYLPELVITHEEKVKVLYQNSFVTNHVITTATGTLIAQVG